MPQNSLSGKIIAGSQMTGVGASSALNLTAATVIKASAGRLAKIIIIAGGTASDGTFTFNDCLTVGTASAANTVLAIPAGATAGTIYNVDFPVANGLVLSAVPTAGSPVIAVSYT